jgi:pimeloyl-ACP methyl ester carboxylesterase
MDSLKKTEAKTIMFITGAFVSSTCWDEWVVFFKKHGYTCVAPPWPNKDAPADELRNSYPAPAIAAMRLNTLTDYFTRQAQALPEKPILIGHSMGGLIVQLLLQKNIAAAGVAIHPVAPQGVITFSWSMLRAVWGPLGYFTPVNKAFMMSFKQWQFAFTNKMCIQEQIEGYEKFAIPESKLISRDGLTNAAKINFNKYHAPLLITSGSDDHIVPSKLNYANYKKYKSFAITNYKEFKGRNHFVLGQETWQEDADYILNWLQSL